ncbi:MAG: hypothetical protein DRH97_00145 [Chloroflexi bacterium]|nr:MAG: hypothetical protein DRH97_00145 [Chloroflexota bacterium]
MTIEILINGEIFGSLKEIKVTDALNSIAGSFEFSTSIQQLEDAGIKEYDDVIVKIDGEHILRGYINPNTVSYSKSSHDLTTGGHGNLIDLVDSSVFANTQYQGPMTFSVFCVKVMLDNGFSGIKVIDESDGDSDFTKEEEMSAKTGDSIFEFLKKYAELKGLVLSSDGLGGLVLYNNTGISTDITMNNRYAETDNEFIKSGKAEYNMSKRFSKIIVKSQGGSDGFAGIARGGLNVEDIQGEALDSDVKRNRTKVIISKTATDAEGCTKQAVWEVNKRRADSIKYNVVVKGHKAPNGKTWRAGMKIAVHDTYADVKSIMLLNSVVYNEAKGGGTTSTLSFIANDAYKLQAEDPTKHTNKIGEGLF